MARTWVWMSIFLLATWSAAVPAAGEPAPDAERTATLGMVAYADPRAQSEAIAPLADHLGRAANLKVTLRMYRDYVSLLNDLDHESLDLAIVSPIVYAFCLGDPELTYLATTLEEGRPFYHAALLARKETGIRSVRDLAGKRIAFVDPYSASGYVYPAAFLLEAGLVKDGKPQYTPVFCGSHEKALRALLEGTVEAAATYENFFAFAAHRVAGRADLSLADFRILKLLPERIPTDAAVCRTALGTGTIRLLAGALDSYGKERARADSPLARVFYTGFRAGRKSAYEAVRAYLEKLPGTDLPGIDDDNPPGAE